MVTHVDGRLPQKRSATVEPISELNKIRIVDNGEPLVDLRQHSPALVLSQNPDPFGQRRLFYVRTTVAEKLNKAALLLPAGHRFLIWYTYRTLETQRATYQKYIDEFRAQHPRWPLNILRREANRFGHPPDVKTPPGHCTGGAVDLTILGPDGEELDMIAPYTDWDAAKAAVAPTLSEGVAPIARRNRELFIKVMAQVGFTNYAGEWWHWSYGDSCWAWRLERKTAIYGLAAIPVSLGTEETRGIAATTQS